MVEALLAWGAPTDSVDVGEGGAGGKGAVARVMLISTAAASATYRLRPCVCVCGFPLTWFRVVQQIIKEECGKMHAQLTRQRAARHGKRKDVRGTLAIVSQRRIS